MKVLHVLAVLVLLAVSASAVTFTNNYALTDYQSRVVIPNQYTISFTGANLNAPYHWAPALIKISAGVAGQSFVCSSVGENGQGTNFYWTSNAFTTVSGGFPPVSIYLSIDSICRVYVFDSTNNALVGQLTAGSDWLVTDDYGHTVEIMVGTI